MRQMSSNLSLRALCGAALLAIAAGFAAHAAAPPASINGMWMLDPKEFGDGVARTPLPLLPAVAAAQAERRKATPVAATTLGDHALKCLPSGMPGMMTNEFALEFLETPGRVTVLSENNTLPRSIYLTESEHTKGLEASWNGHSIGHYEGSGARKTLVVDTVNFNDRLGPITGRGVHSPTTHLVEHYHLESPDVMVGEMTFEDPSYLAKPYTTVHHYLRIKGKAELWEYVCETNAAGWSERFEGDPAAKLTAK
jgi:hypothetical protein